MSVRSPCRMFASFASFAATMARCDSVKFLFAGLATVQNHVLVATQWLHSHKVKRPCYLFNSKVFNVYLGWLMGLEPTTTGITILDSTN